ncbi:MAG: plasmid pRiA4b ORF-3 family protein [Verrucomicrobiae bacterium]|nr:plasmid pRiA4b ORF-3 family protein [Verrucomicrobiae bacterium]
MPPVWRSLLVAGDATLGWLHAALQVAMGWTNSHLHRFGTAAGDFSDSSFELDCGDEGRVRMMDVAPVVGAELEYEYDMGDGWLHHVTVELITGPQGPIARDAECGDGARACPPEDCGGPAGPRFAEAGRGVEAEFDGRAVAEWLWHKVHGALLRKTYSHVRAEHEREMVAKVG